MNKGMIMLGLLLIVGLSFAVSHTWEYPWQSTVYWHYDCSFSDLSYYQYALAYSYMAPYAGPYQMANMYNALYYMNVDKSNMWIHYYATPFKSDVASYNGDNSLFNGIFNSVLRAYIAHADSGQKAYIMSMLQGFRDDYRSCINPVKVVT